CVFLGVEPTDPATVKLLNHLRSFDTTTELFVLTGAQNVRDMAVDKSKYQIHSFLQTPIEPKEFFGLLGRFLERRTERQGSTLRKGGRSRAETARR
ncbi:MAG: hypothetical protein KDC48_17585, partial [Planctomycetes bacterium]|nr:hypothetical protein [Planctomycetota bacterium]